MSNLDRPTPRRGRERGLSLLELLAGLVIGMLVVMSALGTLLLSREAAGTVADLSQLQQQGAFALHVIGLQLRQAGAVELLRNDVTGLHVFGPSRAQAAGTDFAVSGVDGKAGAPDKVSVAYAAAAWTKAPGQFDCSGSGVAGGERVEATFDVDAKGQLSCTGRRKQPLVSGVADFQVRYRVATAAGVQILEAREVEALKGWGAVTAVEICLDLQGNEKSPDPASAYRGCNGSDRPANGRAHLVWRNVFSLRPQ
jgi:type IV pilus assembly protein PilW